MEALLTWDRTVPPSTSPSTQDTSRTCLVPPHPREPLISASSIKVCGRNRGKGWATLTNIRSQECQDEKGPGRVTHMQDQCAACHPVHRLVEQGCRETGRVRGGHARRKQAQTTCLPVLTASTRAGGGAPPPRPLGTTPYPVPRANSEHLEGRAHGFELLVHDTKCWVQN